MRRHYQNVERIIAVGGLAPNKRDIEITQRLKAAGETLGVNLLDHIIFNHKGYCSFIEDKETNQL